MYVLHFDPSATATIEKRFPVRDTSFGTLAEKGRGNRRHLAWNAKGSILLKGFHGCNVTQASIERPIRATLTPGVYDVGFGAGCRAEVRKANGKGSLLSVHFVYSEPLPSEEAYRRLCEAYERLIARAKTAN